MSEEAELSSYERVRLKNIARNTAVMQSLGVPTHHVKRKKKQAVRPRARAAKAARTSSAPTRRSSRARKSVATYSDEAWEDTGASSADDDDDYDGSDSDSDGDGDSEYESDNSAASGGKRKRRGVSARGGRAVTKKPPAKAKAQAVPPVELGGIVCETAKSGRSSCRKCGEKIPQGANRVGMQSWIVGRQALTWQKPVCFLENLTCAIDATGRTRCKATGEVFEKGELKLGARSHTATSFFKPRKDAAGAVLFAVVAMVPREAWTRVEAEVLQVERIDGAAQLGGAPQAVLAELMRDARAAMRAHADGNGATDAPDSTSGDSDSEAPGGGGAKRKAKAGSASATSSQPPVGTKSCMKGRVEWKWGSMTCYGTLLAARETATHCYARTHKGNVKTLAKGKPYWAVVG